VLVIGEVLRSKEAFCPAGRGLWVWAVVVGCAGGEVSEGDGMRAKRVGSLPLTVREGRGRLLV